ncbi:recombinase family protein [Plantactinospora sp. WMMB334]|uniref:recombinase family protein n=1 Tax=Plantactinospora sp. WMMB334 TaxID=3404119 RepID=UPI003B951386
MSTVEYQDCAMSRHWQLDCASELVAGRGAIVTAHARWGRRLHRLAPDPVTAPHVQWIFAERNAGTSAGGIARTLNHLGVPSPSQYDRKRNRHRTADGWTVRTVAEILANPRYTGRQVWNRQYTDHQETEPGDPRTSRGSVRRWNPRDQWILSARFVHPPLVSEADFVKAQAVNAVPAPEDGQPRRYLLTGLVICRACGRRADAHWVHGRPGYRCRHGHTSASPAPIRPAQAAVPTRRPAPRPHRTATRRSNDGSPRRRASYRRVPAGEPDHRHLRRRHHHTRSTAVDSSSPTPEATTPTRTARKHERLWWGLTCPRGELNPHDQHQRAL